MKSTSLALASATVLLISQSVLATAQTTSSSRSRAPGQEFQQKGSVRGDPGASGYSCAFQAIVITRSRPS
jgi:hypothetical protein